MREEFLRLYIYDDAELSELLGGRCESEKIHHWPLSCVLSVKREDGARFICKSQRSGIEAEFFKSASGIELPFLVKPVSITRLDGCDVMLFPYVRDEKAALGAEEHLRLVRSLRSGISLLDGNAPVWMDISTPERLICELNRAAEIIGDIAGAEDIAALLDWAKGSGELFGSVGYVHGDLLASNILVRGGMTYIIDWQRPLLAPTALEEAAAFSLEEADKLSADGGIISRESFRLAAAVQIIWFAAAWRDFMPELTWVKAHAAGLLKYFRV